jgi:AbrB family looped-hinge helix DNA binding protein
MRVTIKGQVTIPKEIRNRLGIGPGSEVEFVEQDNVVLLRRRQSKSRETAKDFDDWARSVAGTLDTGGLDGKAYVDWLRGDRDDLDAG